MNKVIQVENLGKRYRLGQSRQERYTTLRDVLTEKARSLGQSFKKRTLTTTTLPNNPKPELWALKNVWLEVGPGEVVGIIGRNGAGKSTLLKLLSRITAPTSGKITLRGRVASLLEVGTGFHPELTGRQNIFLSGAIMGMRRAEINQKFEEIVAFAEIEKFLDTPVKRYSSGMYTRLAFAVAAHLEPEILLVDEVLAVGDAAFQKKSIGKLGTVANEGRTILFVSHNLNAVQNLCQRVIWLDGGQILEEGPPRPLIARYLNSAFSALTEQSWSDQAQAPGNEQVRLGRIALRLKEELAAGEVTVKTPFSLEFEYWNLREGADLSLSLVLLDEAGVVVFASDSLTPDDSYNHFLATGLFRSVCQIPADFLNAGTYRVQLYVVRDQCEDIFCLEDALIFEIREATRMRRYAYHKWPGVVRPALSWQTELIKPG
jgi:lipopolysaccharide transport system ATP-binding protein